jgi:peroxiredoxin
MSASKTRSEGHRNAGAGGSTRPSPQPLPAGSGFPRMTWPCAGGGEVSSARKGWFVMVVYRGHHCSMCKQYLIELNSMQESFGKASVAVFAVSADDQERAEAWLDELGLRFPLGFGLSKDQMTALGLYVSPREEGVPHEFSEPAVFIVRDDGTLHFASVSNAPYGRPPLRDVLEGVRKAIEDDLPPHGTRWPKATRAVGGAGSVAKDRARASPG